MTELMAVIDGKPVPLADATWIFFFACGCAYGACTAQLGDEACATEDQALREMYPLKRDRDRFHKRNGRLELMPWDRYRREIDLSVLCSHTLAQRTGKAPVDDAFPSNGGHDSSCAYVGGLGNCTCTPAESEVAR